MPKFLNAVTTAAVTIGDGSTVALGTTTGTKLGTSTTQKLGFYNSTPIIKPSGDILTALTNLGLVASPTISQADITGLVAALAAKASATITSVSVSGATTLTSSAFGTNQVLFGTSADYTVTLPTATGNDGQPISFQGASGLTRRVTLAAASGQQIVGANGGASSQVMWANETAVLKSDGSNWIAVGGRRIAMNCVIRQSAANQTVPDSTMTPITLDTVEEDNTGAIGNPTGNNLVALRGGNYSVAVVAAYSNFTADAPRVLVAPFQTPSGGSPAQLKQYELSALTGGFPTFGGPQDVTLAAGDTVDMRTYQTSGSDQSLAGAATGTAPFLMITEKQPW